MWGRIALIVAVLASGAPAISARPRVWIADQTTNEIYEIHPFDHQSPPASYGDIVIVNEDLGSPAGAFPDELTFDDADRLWVVVKDQLDPQTQRHPDGARRIDKETGTVDDPPGTINPVFPGEAYGGHLEGLAWDGVGLWVSAVREGQANFSMLTRVDPATGNQIAPFDSGTLGAKGYVFVPGNVAQGLLWQPGNGGYGWLWHSDVFQQKIYKLDISRLFTDPNYDPNNENGLKVAEFSVPFKPKGMDWMEDKIWVTAPAGDPPWNPGTIAGIYEFDPATGNTGQLFNTPLWSLDGLAILPPPGPKIVLSTSAINASVWVGAGNPPNDSFTVANGAADTLHYEIDDDAGAAWLSVAPASGTSTGEADPISVMYEVADFVAGVYTATITVTGDAYNSPQTIAVTLTVETVLPDLDGDGDVDQQDFGLFQRCYAGPGVLPAVGCGPADFQKDGDVDAGDFTVYQRCASGANVPAAPSCDDP